LADVSEVLEEIQTTRSAAYHMFENLLAAEGKITNLEIARTGHGCLLIKQPKGWIITSSTCKTSTGQEVLCVRCLGEA